MTFYEWLKTAMMAGQDKETAMREAWDAATKTEREASAAFCGRLAEMMELGAGEMTPGGRLRQAEETILRGDHYPFDKRSNAKVEGAEHSGLPLERRREKYGADTKRMDFLERQNHGRFDEISGPDVFAVMFDLIEPAKNTLREAVDAAMADDETRNAELTGAQRPG